MKPKGNENIGIIKSFYRAISNGNPIHARSVLDPQIEWVEPSPEKLPFGGWHRGADAVFKEVIDIIHDNIREFQVKTKQFFAVGEKVVVLGHCTGRGRVTDIKLDAPTVHIWTLADGRAVRFEALHDVLEWQVALGRPIRTTGGVTPEKIVDSGAGER